VNLYPPLSFARRAKTQKIEGTFLKIVAYTIGVSWRAINFLLISDPELPNTGLGR